MVNGARITPEVDGEVRLTVFSPKVILGKGEAAASLFVFSPKNGAQMPPSQYFPAKSKPVPLHETHFNARRFCLGHDGRGGLTPRRHRQGYSSHDGDQG